VKDNKQPHSWLNVHLEKALQLKYSKRQDINSKRTNFATSKSNLVWLKWTNQTSQKHIQAQHKAKCAQVREYTSDLTYCRNSAHKAISSISYSKSAHFQNKLPNAFSLTWSMDYTNWKHKASLILTSNRKMYWLPTMTSSNWATLGSWLIKANRPRLHALALKDTTHRRLQKVWTSTPKRQIYSPWDPSWSPCWCATHCSLIAMQPRTTISTS
jgi:hypothetical protein